MIDRVLAEITGQTKILIRDRVRCVGAQSDVVPVGRALRMADTVEVIRVLVEMERGRAVLDGTRERLKEAANTRRVFSQEMPISLTSSAVFAPVM